MELFLWNYSLTLCAPVRDEETTDVFIGDALNSNSVDLCEFQYVCVCVASAIADVLLLIFVICNLTAL